MGALGLRGGFSESEKAPTRGKKKKKKKKKKSVFYVNKTRFKKLLNQLLHAVIELEHTDDKLY